MFCFFFFFFCKCTAFLSASTLSYGAGINSSNRLIERSKRNLRFVHLSARHLNLINLWFFMLFQTRSFF
uniref:Putative secreted protein n=1 Tax=Rhipicephalus microplus TaxID=6941 RepID=A0A6M2DFD1_RHIMP